MEWLFGDSSDKKSIDAKNEIKSRYGNCCALCKNLDINNMMSGGWFSSAKYKCYKGWCTLTERNSCVKEISADPNYGRDFTKVYEMITGRRYYILTAISEILGYDLNNPLFTEIIALTDIVRSDESTAREAIGYDSFGPEIADMLRADRNRIDVCNYLLYNYIVKIYNLIGLKKEEEAIKLYEDMVKYLYFRYKNMENQSAIIDVHIFENKKILVK